jgi:cell division protein FtsL
MNPDRQTEFANSDAGAEQILSGNLVNKSKKITKMTIVLIAILTLVIIGSAFVTISKSTELQHQNEEVEKIQEQIRNRSEYLNSL